MKFFKHLNISSVAEMIPQCCTMVLLKLLKNMAPRILHMLIHKGHMVAMEYGIKDGEEFDHHIGNYTET